MLALLGSVWSGIENIKTHQWFTGFSWSEMESLSMQPPYVRVLNSREPAQVKRADMRTREIQVPTVKSKTDMTNFCDDVIALPPQIPYEDPKTGWDQHFATCEWAGHRRLAPFWAVWHESGST